MKKVFLIGFTLCFALLAGSSSMAFDKVGKLGVGINGGLVVPASGDITTDSTLSDFFDVGPGFGVDLTYGVSKEFSLAAGFTYSFMKMKDEVNDDPDNEPHLNMPAIYLDGVFNFGSLMNNPDNIINPIISAGVGMYPWKATIDGASGDPIVLENGEEFKATSFGINFGAGVEVFATPDLAVYAKGKYHMIFSEDEDKFGTEFGNMGAISITAGLNYYFPLYAR